MGGSESHMQQPLVALSEPICAVEPRFCLPHPVHLRIREKYFSFSGDDFKISDPHTGVVYFQCQGSAFSMREKKTLLDNTGHPVLNMKEALMSFTDKFTLYAGGNSERKICKFHAQLNFIKAKISAEFQDVTTGKPRLVVLKGDWLSKQCTIYLGEPKGGGVPIGRVYRPMSGRALMLGKQDYMLEVAPGVDISLLVIMCIALDEHKKD